MYIYIPEGSEYMDWLDHIMLSRASAFDAAPATQCNDPVLWHNNAFSVQGATPPARTAGSKLGAEPNRRGEQSGNTT